MAREIDANQYRIVHLAAGFDEELVWFRRGFAGAARWISAQLGIHASTAREWIRVGYALRYLPVIDAAFAAGEVSYAKVRILTRWADPGNEADLMDLAYERSADRLTTAISKKLADGDETDEERDLRLHEARSFTSRTDGDGMTVIRVTLPPAIAKPVLAAIDELVRRIASTPIDLDTDMAGEAVGCGPNDATADRAQGDRNAPADASCERSVAAGSTESGQDAPADASDRRSVTELVAPGDIGCDGAGTRTRALDELRRRWQPMTDFGAIPTLAQQRADAFAALFLGLGVDLVTEIVIHVRGDGVTFDDGTPTTSSAVVRQLDGAFIRLMIHDTERRPINASNRRRFPTPAQRRVTMEMHGHECVDCQSTDLLELDHNPPFHQTGHTSTDELEPRCAPCHRARHRYDHLSKSRAA